MTDDDWLDAMQTDDTKLARRAVACEGWRWMPAMSTNDMLVVDADETVISIVRKETVQDHWAPKDALPDLTDPATLGCVLALVREAWGDPSIHVRMMDDHIWGAYARIRRRPISVADTERAALVAALEAAPVGGAS